MNSAWFDPNLWAWLPGTLFGCLGGLWGALAGVLAPGGKARGFVIGTGMGLIAASAVMLVVGAVGLAMKQPFWVWFAFVLPGLQGVFLLGFLLPMVARRYGEAEQGKIAARDLA